MPDFSSEEAAVIIGGRTASLQLVSANGASVRVSVAVPPGAQTLAIGECEAMVAREAALVMEAAARHLLRASALEARAGNASLSTTPEIEPAY